MSCCGYVLLAHSFSYCLNARLELKKTSYSLKANWDIPRLFPLYHDERPTILANHQTKCFLLRCSKKFQNKKVGVLQNLRHQHRDSRKWTKNHLVRRFLPLPRNHAPMLCLPQSQHMQYPWWLKWQEKTTTTTTSTLFALVFLVAKKSRKWIWVE